MLLIVLIGADRRILAAGIDSDLALDDFAGFFLNVHFTGADANQPEPMTAKERYGLRMPSQIGKLVCSRWFPTLTLDPNPMTKIRFDNGTTVTIRDGMVQAPSPTLTAFLDTLASRLPGYGSIPFVHDEDLNIARGLIERIGAGKILHRDDTPPLPSDINRRNSERDSGLTIADDLLNHSRPADIVRDRR